ncbi:YbaL family putative K(+) efflux transporter [Phenylobacterium terrae]|uniref:YbaL family putative K(+) efflux transporter n=1 Tax=Phenylobacterium terrae TaxID=2665495 RepID=A0ABW4N6D3_9CAUL
MHHDTSLITTVVMGLVFAFAGGFLAAKVRLPPLVGYLLAGIAVGPFTPGFTGDEEIATQLAELGVILLMFGVGLHFSIRDLLAVRNIAVPGALGQIAAATAMGAGLAHLWGWGLGAGLVFGLALSVASTVVLLRALEQRRAIDTVNGRIAVGWLIVEDLVMVLSLVLLPALAGPLGGDPAVAGGAAANAAGGVWGALGLTVLKVGLFLALVLTVGSRVAPWLLRQVAKVGSRELFTLAVLATALGIAYGSAELFGVSFALGAFFAGVVLSETDFSHQAAADSLPLQDAFAVLFFVSVGMLFDPTILVREPLAVAAVVAVIVFGKSIAAFGIVLAFGYPAGTALTVSASLAQIGEFSFILAALGVSLGLLPEEGRDLILAGALLSITLNPIAFATIDPIMRRLRARPDMLAKIERKGDEALAKLPTGGDEGPSDHAIIVGYGRVGRRVGDILRSQGLAVVAVDEDRRRVEALRKEGVAAVYGDAANTGVLEAAGLRHAKLLIVATPGSYQTQRIIDAAREVNPTIDTAVRTHSDSQVAELARKGVGIAIMGERELALGLLEYALTRMGVDPGEARLIVAKARLSGEGGVFERQFDAEPRRPAPERRPARNYDA